MRMYAGMGIKLFSLFPRYRRKIALLTAAFAVGLIWNYKLLSASIHPHLSLSIWTDECHAYKFSFTDDPVLVTATKLYRDDKMLNSSSEDRMLQKYMQLISAANGPDSAVLKAVITILANQPRAKLLMESLQRLHKCFNSQFRYPVIVFHEENFKPHLAEVRAIGFDPRLNMSSIFFQQVDLSVPSSYLKKFGQPPWEVCGRNYSFGYRSMCRFHAKMIYEEPMMRHFDYQWRLDDDSLIDKHISFDVFAALQGSECSYGYYHTMIDDCAHNTFGVASEYIETRGIRPTFFHQLKWNEIFYNNFEVSKLKIWRSRQYRDFIDYVDSLGGIYTHRWGDAPIKTLGLSMFVPLTEICQFTNISYKHRGLSSPLTTKFLSK